MGEFKQEHPRLSKDTGLVSVQRSDIVCQATFQPYPGSDPVDLKEKPGYTLLKHKSSW